MANTNKPFQLQELNSVTATDIGAMLDWYERVGLPDEWRESVERTLTSSRTAITRFHEEATKIKGSEMFSERGRASQLAELRDSILPDVKRLSAEAATYRTRALNERQAAVPVPLKGIDAVLEQLQLQERRAHLKTLDPLVLQTNYLSAARTGDDPQLERAVEGALWMWGSHEVIKADGTKQSVQTFPAKVLAEAAENRALRVRPIVGDLESMASMYEGLANIMLREVGAYAPDPIPVGRGAED